MTESIVEWWYRKLCSDKKCYNLGKELGESWCLSAWKGVPSQIRMGLASDKSLLLLGEDLEPVDYCQGIPKDPGGSANKAPVIARDTNI